MAQINTLHSRHDDIHLAEIVNAIESWKEAPRSRISGIANQGATCYLNTLLQTLLHTPDLTNSCFVVNDACIKLGRLFGMAKNTEVTRLKRILQELLVLFSNLLQGDGIPVSAKALTDSFGWSSDEVLVHRDIQELNRLLFEQLEYNLKDTSEETLISDLYKGVLRTTIECLTCGQVSERNDEFQDVNLSVSECDSVEDALDYHTQSETLVGENQYFCDNCNCRVNATKISKFTELPPVLTLSLSRFYFNPKTMEACKLDKMCSFPTLLDMTKYLAGKRTEPVTYDLFSIVIHVGADACGGHYHAYIKDPYGFTGESLTAPPPPTLFQLSDLKDGQTLETEPVQTNTNHLFTCYQNVSKPVSSSAMVQMRAQSQRRPLRALHRQAEQATDSTHHELTVAPTPLPVRRPPRMFHSTILNKLTRPPSSQVPRVPPGVETCPASLVSRSSLDRARSRRKTRILPNSVAIRVHPSSELTGDNVGGQVWKGSSMIKKKTNTYSRFVDSMKAGLIATQRSSKRSISLYNHQNGSTTYIKLTKDDQSTSASTYTDELSNRLRQSPTLRSKSPSGSTINIEVTDRSDQTNSPSTIGKPIATCGNNEDNLTPMMSNSKNSTKSQSQRSSRTSSGCAEVWRSKLFRQTVKRSNSSSSDLVKLPTHTPIRALHNDLSITPVPTLELIDSVLVHRRFRREDRGNVSPQSGLDDDGSYANVKAPCGALRVTRGGENPVVYGKWFDFNDDVVSEVSCESFKHVFKGLECAYMLFYKRTGQSIA